MFVLHLLLWQLNFPLALIKYLWYGEAEAKREITQTWMGLLYGIQITDLFLPSVISPASFGAFPFGKWIYMDEGVEYYIIRLHLGTYTSYLKNTTRPTAKLEHWLYVELVGPLNSTVNHNASDNCVKSSLKVTNRIRRFLLITHIKQRGSWEEELPETYHTLCQEYMS